MNGAPLVFYERVFSNIRKLTLEEASELSGTFGKRAQCAYLGYASYSVAVEDGSEVSGHVRIECSKRELHKPEEIDAVPKKFVRAVSIYMEDAKNENVCRNVVKRFPYGIYVCVLRSSFINKAWIDFACRLKALKTIMICYKLEDDSLRLFKKLVDCGNLLLLHTYEDACEGGMMEVLKSLLCQDQFEELEIKNDGEIPCKGYVVRELLQFWSQNNEKLRGKHLFVLEKCEDSVKQLEEFVIHRKLSALVPRLLSTPGIISVPECLSLLGIQWALKRCSKEECDAVDKYYRQHHKIIANPSCVYKFEEGQRCDLRRLYISFECTSGRDIEEIRPASHTGHDQLSLMRGTGLLHLVFD
uniref:NB-ARC domain-containing protein n=1 Tax=Steinernema glaseri TaxID=37863 RepID=A0A1I7Z1S9_9BILA